MNNVRCSTPAAYQLLHKGTLALAKMEHNGIRINVDLLESTIEGIDRRIKRLQDKLRDDEVYSAWRRTFGQKANLGSREQLAKVVFDVLKHPYEGDRTATGRYKTDADSLSEVNVPFVKRFVKVEKLKKVRSTYLGGISREVVDGFLHPSFNLHTVRTFRGSSSDPNFQNIPIRDPAIGKIIRSLFVPRKGRVLVENDFGALEFRIAACVAGPDPEMLRYVRDKRKDIHRDMGAKCYKIPKELVNKTVRYCGKNGFVFPKLYGSYWFQIAANLWNMIAEHSLSVELPGDGEAIPLKRWLAQNGVHELGTCKSDERPVPGTFQHHVKGIEDEFERRFSVLTKWQDEWYETYRRNGGFPLVTGFWVSGLYSKNDTLNYPIQGPGFHCLLWTLIELQKEIRKRRMKALLVGQIHDCVIGDVPEDEVQDYLHLVKEIVEVRLPKAWPWIIVPLEIEAEVATANWFAKVAWVEKNGVWGPKEAA